MNGPVSAILKSPDKWCKRVFAQDALGLPCELNSGRAARFCLVGAMTRVRCATGFPVDPESKILRAVEKLFPGRGPTVPEFNDHPDTTFEDVKKVLDYADL